jgi:hypothetical protein
MTLDPEQPIEDHKIEDAVFGREVAAFLQNDRIGRYIVRRAADEVEAAMLDLKDVDPEKPSDIRAIQMRIQVAESVVGWLVEAVDRGSTAEKILEDEA